MRKWLILGLIASTMSFSAAFGADKPKASAEDKFKKLDTNGDGKLSMDEFKAGQKDATKAEAAFKKMDKDNDGFLTLEEYKAGMEHGKKAK